MECGDSVENQEFDNSLAMHIEYERTLKLLLKIKLKSQFSVNS